MLLPGVESARRYCSEKSRGQITCVEYETEAKSSAGDEGSDLQRERGFGDAQRVLEIEFRLTECDFKRESHSCQRQVNRSRKVRAAKVNGQVIPGVSILRNVKGLGRKDHWRPLAGATDTSAQFIAEMAKASRR